MTGWTSTRGWFLALPYAVYAGVVVSAIAWSGNRPAQTLLLTVAFGLLQLLGLVFSLRAATHPGLRPVERRPWRYVAAAFGILLLSEAAFLVAYDGARLRSMPALALGTLIRVVYFLALLRGMFLFSVPQRRSANYTWKLLLDITTVVGGGVMLIWYFLLGPVVDRASSQPDLLWQGPLGYAIGDLLLVFGVCAVLLSGATTSARLPLFLLLAGATANLVTDIVASYLSLYYQDQPFGSAWQTILLPLAVALTTAAAVEQCRQAGSGRASPPPRTMRRPTWLPYLTVAIGFLLLIVAAARASIYPWWGLVFGATVMTFAVAARQILALRENHQLIVTDNLTGLASRVHLGDTLRRVPARSRGQLVAVLQIDLDDFKRVNDVYGHETGDAYLAAFAEVLRTNVRDQDLAARLGGDEFAILLNGVRDGRDAAEVASRILQRAQDPIEIGGHVLRMRASIGIAVAPATDLDIDQLLHRADLAMYVAKRRRTHSFQLYAEGAVEDDEDTMRRMITDSALTTQLRLAYQPIVALTTGDLVAVEALVRWQHPTRGMVAPQEFIPLAEDAGTIHEIDMWVVDEASRQVAAWRRRLPSGRRLDLTVNLSPRELVQDTLAQDVLKILRRNDFPPAHLVAEVTEGGVVEDGVAIAQLDELRRHGVRIALDDFGTGYSSLRYLTRLPVDILKLDRCFVGELNGQPEGSAVAEAVVRLARILHLDTVAEGVEDQRQVTELTLHGYQNAQGFHFSRPVTAVELDQVIDAAGDGWPRLGPTPAAVDRATS